MSDLVCARVHVLQTAAMSGDLLGSVRGLLDVAFGGSFSRKDWEHTLGGWHFIVMETVPVAHAAVVPRAIEAAGRHYRCGYVEGVATAPGKQGQGLGALTMTEVGGLLRREFDMGALSTGRHSFYRRLGWERWLGPSYVRRGGDLVRTEEEDDGIMVLRFGPSIRADLEGPIVCDARVGDDW